VAVDLRPAPMRWGAALSAASLAALCGYVTAVDPNRPGHYPTCPVYALTGLYCPGCGGLRAVHDLFTGDLVGALHCNVLLMLFLPVAFALWLRTAVGNRPVPALPRPAGIGLVVLLGVWVVARNLPYWPFVLIAPISR
jgi:hypothetical protein